MDKNKCNSCGEAPQKRSCKNKDFTKAVIEIDNPEQITLIRKVVIPTSMGDDTTVPPVVGKYHNVLLYYEANSKSYLYSSDGIPTQLVNGVTDYEEAVNLPQINGVTLIGNRTSSQLGLQPTLSVTPDTGIKLENNELSGLPATDTTIGMVKPGDGLEVDTNGTMSISDIEQHAHFFDTVADMKAATNLVAGDYARTLGFHSINDRGGALYYISSTGTANEMDIISVGNLYASIVYNGSVAPEQLGCYNDQTHDDGAYIQSVIDISKNSGIHVRFGHSIYYVSTPINIPLEYSIDFQGITLKAVDATNFTEGMVNIKSTWNIHNGVISNLKLDQNNLAPKGIYLYRSFRRTYENIDIKNTPAGGYGIYLDGDRGGGGNQFNNITGSGNYRNSTFIYVGSNDSVFSHVDYQQYTVGIETNAFVRLFDIHGYVATDDQFPEDWYTGSIFIKIDSRGHILADELYPDTHNFSFYNYSVLPSQIGKIFFTYNENTPQNSITSVMFKANNDNVELYYRWRVESLLLGISSNVLFELIKNSTESTLSSYLHLNNLSGTGDLNIDKPPVFVNRLLAMTSYTKLGIYEGTLVATGTSPNSSVSAPRDICKTDVHSGYKLIDGYYPYKGINPDDSSVFDGTVKVENNTVTVMPNANQGANFQFFIQVPAQEANISV